MKTSLPSDKISPILDALSRANRNFGECYPGDNLSRQPVHVVYGGADRFAVNTSAKMGAFAQQMLTDYAPNFVRLAQILDLPGSQTLPESETAVEELVRECATEAPSRVHRPIWLAHQVYESLCRKLSEEPVEDFRIDFEDGFGSRSDEEEDEVAVSSAKVLAEAMDAGTLPPFSGMRIKALTEELYSRAVRTMDLFFTALFEASGNQLPEHFVVTLPKVTLGEQVKALDQLLAELERSHGIDIGTIKIEIMIETPQAIINDRSQIGIRNFIDAANGRCWGIHFGTYDYCSSLDLTANAQSMESPVADFARHFMKVTAAGTGVFLSDGATNVLPVPHHRPEKGRPLSVHEATENQQLVHHAWKTSYRHIRRSLNHGFYQGWDLHPGQLIPRYAACYAFYLEHLPEMQQRLRNFVQKATKATVIREVFDDAATAQGLLNFFIRALNCRAIGKHELEETGLSLEEVQAKSFTKIMNRRLHN